MLVLYVMYQVQPRQRNNVQRETVYRVESEEASASLTKLNAKLIPQISRIAMRIYDADDNKDRSFNFSCYCGNKLHIRQRKLWHCSFLVMYIIYMYTHTLGNSNRVDRKLWSPIQVIPRPMEVRREYVYNIITPTLFCCHTSIYLLRRTRARYL